MYHARHAKPHHWLALVVTLVALFVVGATVYANSGRDSGQSPAAADVGPPDTSPSARQTASAEQTPTAGDDADDDAVFRRALESCRAAWTAQARELRAAQASLEQWNTHIRAMNRLVAGAITLQQAKAFWSASRAGAAQRVARFEAIDKRSRGASTQCSSPPEMDHATHMQHLAACRQAADAREAVLSSSRTAIGTWRRHIRDMELLRAGKISPFQGLQRWNKNWKQGDAELHRYREIRQTAMSMAPC
jgi:hypothetical protein